MKSRCTILIVEDDPVTGEIALHHIRRQGYRPVGPARTYEQAIALLTAESVDIALLDLHLTGDRSGIDVARWMIEHTPHVPHAYLTGEDNPELLKSAQQTDPIALLFKTLSPASLGVSIDVVLRNFGSSPEPEPEPEPTLPMTEGQVTRLVSASQILYAQTDHVYINVILDDGTPVLYRGSMRDLMQRLMSSEIVQTHRRYSINTSKITALDGNYIWLGEHKVPMSRRRRSELKRLVGRLNPSHPA